MTPIVARTPRVVPVRETALYAAALREIKRLTAENRELHARLGDTAESERRLDLRSDFTRGDLSDDAA